MEMTPGSKRTEVGIVPKDWEVSKLGTHATFKTGPFGSALHQSDYVEGGVPVINPIQIVDGKIKPTASMAITESAAKKLSEFRLSSGDVIIARRGQMGRCAFVRPEEHGWLCGTGSMIIRTRPSLDARFIQLVLSNPPIIAEIEHASVGSTMINLNQGTLGNLLVPIPSSKTEQRAIAAALGDADAFIESLEQLLAKKRQLRKAATQALLTGTTRLPGFGGDWPVKHFGEIATLRKERVDPRGTVHHEFCVELEHLEQGTGRLAGFTATSEGLSLRSVFRKDDVLFGKLRAYLRKSWLADREGVCSTEIWVLAANRALVTPQFLFQLVRGDRFVEAASSTYGTHMPRSDWKVVENLEVQLPRTPEQSAIADILSQMDAEIAELDAALSKTSQLKQGMMHELLTGRIRLV